MSVYQKTIKKFCFLAVLLFCFFVPLFIFSSDTHAAALNTDVVYFDWQPENSNSYIASERFVMSNPNFALDNSYYAIFPVKYARLLFLFNSQIQTQGNHASIHFETNVVASRADSPGTPLPLNAVPYFLNNDYLSEYMTINYCMVDNAIVNIESQSLSYAQTEWLRLNVFPSVTLTIYGDLVLSGIPASGTHQLQCVWGATNQVFFNNTTYNFQSGLYVEQNPASILYSNNLSDAILNQTVAQNEAIIQNQEIITNYLTDTTPPSADTSILGSSAGWLPPGPVDSILTLPIQFAQGLSALFGFSTGQCSPITVPVSIFNTTFQIPCLSSYFRDAGIEVIWNVVGSIISGLLLYKTLRWLYKFVDDTLTFRENNSGLWGGL